jgi:hypothetical protein
MKDNLEAERNSVTDVGAADELDYDGQCEAAQGLRFRGSAACQSGARCSSAIPCHPKHSRTRSTRASGIIWGAGQALVEQSEMDPVLGRFLNRNYTGYLVPTSADIPELETLFVGEFDEEASLLGAEGLGELTAVSVAPAITNVVYHATGKRIRDLPITIEKLL